MSEKLGRNDPCYCGSNKKYKNCHLKPFFPKEFFECKISEFENIKFENRIPPNAGIEVGEVKVYYSNPYPWDEEIFNLLQPLEKANWDENERWENRIKKRITKLRHKIEILKYNIETFKRFESFTENDWKGFIEANTTLNKIYDDPNLIMNAESFLFQSKSCLDVFAQIIAYSFRFEISTYQDFGNGLIKHLEKISSDHLQDVGKIIEIIGDSISWVRELVEMRNDVTHWSDLDGLSCFFIKQAKEKDVLVKVYYPAMPDGNRVSKYMDKTLDNIFKMIRTSAPILVKAAKTRYNIGM